jgi:hypothetical protein
MQNAMSALPLKADMCGANTNVRFVPIADMAQTQVQFYFITNGRALGSSSVDGRNSHPNSRAFER